MFPQSASFSLVWLFHNTMIQHCERRVMDCSSQSFQTSKDERGRRWTDLRALETLEYRIQGLCSCRRCASKHNYMSWVAGWAQWGREEETRWVWRSVAAAFVDGWITQGCRKNICRIVNLSPTNNKLCVYAYLEMKKQGSIKLEEKRQTK